MLVDSDNFKRIVHVIGQETELGPDTETTGLEWWENRLFSLIIGTRTESYYFNFNTTPDHLGVWPENKYRLRRDLIKDLAYIFNRPNVTHYFSNAKFDMHMLANEGIEIKGRVIDLQSRERLLRNNLFLFDKAANLDNLGKHYLGEGKSELVEEYISKHQLFETLAIPGKKKKVKRKAFDKVPFPIVSTYGLKDGKLHLGVGLAQDKRLRETVPLYASPDADLFRVDENEIRLTKTCFRMEREGLRVRVDYTRRALEFEQQQCVQLKAQFQSLTGSVYVDSRTCFVPAFERLGLAYSRTAKGNPSFNAEALEMVQNPVAELITKIRGKEKQIGTYYSSFLHFMDKDEKIHASIKQWGTETGRMSYSDPNLQNVPKQEDEEDRGLPFHVRGCFAPDDQDFCLVSVDYKQQEFRMILDYAGEKKLIAAINEGYDPHDATAKETGLSRRDAKILNFGIAYGMGPDVLALKLKCTVKEAVEKREQYFGRMRSVRRFMHHVNSVARTRGWVRNWLGRVCRVDNYEFAYILFNHLIQGGCAEVCKVAMNRVDEVLLKTKSKLLVQVHDELLFKVHKDELDIVPRLQAIMDNVYIPQNGMPLPTSCDHSWVSWAHFDKVKGLPAWNDTKTVPSKTSQSSTPTRFM